MASERREFRGRDAEPFFCVASSLSEIDELYVAVLSMDSEEVVAIIEVLSPTNKAPDSTGREDYLRKQREILHSPTHLLEIDLLRGRAHAVAVGREAVLSQTQYDCLISLRRAGNERKSRFAVWALSVRDVLPTITVPLLPGWANVPLDLKAVWNDTYQEGRWERTINYRHTSEPPLSPADTIWADALLREKGLRA
ncbi:MAG: DUF4058 family protein [Fibrella sp.]|nr:DUF4058 family protein [Armatimonadota bacterium]